MIMTVRELILSVKTLNANFLYLLSPMDNVMGHSVPRTFGSKFIVTGVPSESDRDGNMDCGNGIWILL